MNELREIRIEHDLRASDVDGWFNPQLKKALLTAEWYEDRHLDEMSGCDH